jgi:hypothetical protein
MSEVRTTVFEVVSTGQEFSVPGDWTAEQIVSSYGAHISGLGSMSSEVTLDGDTKSIVFRPRTGTKG